MIKFMYILIFVFPMLLIGQVDSIDECYANAQKMLLKSLNGSTPNEGRRVYKGADQPHLGYPMQGKIAEGKYENGVKVGEWTLYYKDGVTPKCKGSFVNDAPSGEYFKYHPNGTIKETGTIRNGHYYGHIERFDVKGTLRYQAQYNSNGREEDTVYYYHKTGQPELIYYARNGQPKGQALRYTKFGDLKKVIWYDQNGEIREKFSIEADECGQDYHTSISRLVCLDLQKEARRKQYEERKITNTSGAVIMDGIIKNGQLWDGKRYIYNKDGVLQRIINYSNGAIHAEESL
ncbi:MAG: toxin-antitoxin system YwqK family antitoxin [Bacteroidota bacterium]